MKRLSCVLALCLILAACSGAKKSLIPEVKPADKPKVENEVEVKRLWSRSIGGSFDSDNLGFAIAQTGETIFAASQQGRVSAIDANSGKLFWQINSKETISAGVGLGSGLVLVATVEGKVLAFEQSDGKLAWERQMSSEILTAPAAAEGSAIVRSLDGKVSGLNLSDGEVRWTIQRDLPRLSLRGESQPLLLSGVAVVGFPSGNLIAVRINDGTVIWDIPVSTPTGANEIERLNDLLSKPLVIGKQLIANTYQGAVIGVDIPSRQLKWRQPVSSFRNISTDSLAIYLTDENGNVIALDAASGEVLWNKDYLRYRNVSAPTLVGDYVLIFGNEKDMYLVQRSDGRLVGNYSFADQQLVGTPLVTPEGRFYALSDDGDVHAYQIGSAKQ